MHVPRSSVIFATIFTHSVLKQPYMLTYTSMWWYYRLNILRGTTRQAFFLFLSFAEFVSRCAQWLRYRSLPAIFPDVEAERDLYLQAGSGGETTCRLLSVLDSDLEYLTRDETENITARFEGIPSSLDRLLFWTGLPRKWAQRWADEHGMLTLTSAMGPLMDIADLQCLKRKKKGKDWSRYVKGASSIFSRYACTCGVIRVLTVPPSEAWRLRPNSTSEVCIINQFKFQGLDLID